MLFLYNFNKNILQRFEIDDITFSYIGIKTCSHGYLMTRHGCMPIVPVEYLRNNQYNSSKVSKDNANATVSKLLL